MAHIAAHKKPAEVVCNLLGVRALARALDLTPGAVSKWHKNGLIPSRHHARILEFAREREVRLTPSMLICGVGS